MTLALANYDVTPPAPDASRWVSISEAAKAMKLDEGTLRQRASSEWANR